MISWRLSVNGQEGDCFPVYGDSLSVRYEKDGNEQFFRQTLSDGMTFIAADYDRIISGGMTAHFHVTAIDDESGEAVFQGGFVLTDCEVDEDARTVKVTPTANDAYGRILNGMDKEFDLFKIGAPQRFVTFDKRPVLQIYKGDSDHVTNILGGIAWETEVDGVSAGDAVNTYHFSAGATIRVWSFTSEQDYRIRQSLTELSSAEIAQERYLGNGLYLQIEIRPQPETYSMYIFRVYNSDDVLCWLGLQYGFNPPFSLTLNPQDDAPVTGTLTITVNTWAVLARLLSDQPTIGATTGSPVSLSDFAGAAYKYAYPFAVPEANLMLDGDTSADPTEWGLKTDGSGYFEKPELPAVFGQELFPILQSDWADTSFWFFYDTLEWMETSGRVAVQIPAFPLAGVVNALLGAIDAGVGFDETSNYSLFFYGSNPVFTDGYHLYITPKTNITTGGGSQAARKGTTSLRQVLDMLRACYRVFWYVDIDGNFRLEHISYFMSGESYTTAPGVGKDLTQERFSRNGMPWATGQGQYKFDKPDTYSRIEFGWMDDVTEPFKGAPVNIIAPFIEEGKIESVQVSNFTSDVDYMLTAGESISKDGFALLAVNPSTMALTYWQTEDNDVLQNGVLAFDALRRYYLYDLPAIDYEVDGEMMQAYGVRKIKRQTVRAPWGVEFDLNQLVRTSLGDGQIISLNLNLQSLEGEAELML